MSAAQIRSALTESLAVRRGTALTVRALVPGKLSVSWTSGHTLVASGSATFTRAGTRTIRLRLTRAGRRLLGHVRLTEHGTFVPTGGGAITVSSSLSSRAVH